MKYKILVTGCAGFIGFHTILNLLSSKKKYDVYGIDNVNDYYDIKLKLQRLNILKKYKDFKFNKLDIKSDKKILKYFQKNKFNYVVHLAAQAGVRHSIKNPREYTENNVSGFFNVLEACRINKVKHLIYASSSSVYGDNKNFPLKESDITDHPSSFYAATKKTNEVMAHAYSNIYNLPCTGLRFFTVYGPYGRPDMALYKFAEKINSNKFIELYNYGNHMRDFTYIDDIINGILRLLEKPSKKNIPHEIYNIGNGDSKPLKMFLKLIEKNLNKKAKLKLKKLQKGDVVKTHADISKIKNKVKYNPKFNISSGIKNFISWYKQKNK